MGRRLLTGIIVLAVLAFGGAFFGSPILAVQSLVRAAETGDEARLEQLVDFPAFRDSLKGEMAGRLTNELRDRAGGLGAGLGGLGMILAPSLVDSAIDSLITPRVVANVVSSGREPGARDLTHRSDPGAEAAARPDDRVHRAYGYRDLNTFVVRLTRQDRPDQQLNLLMTRQGLFNWKLTGIELPET